MKSLKSLGVFIIALTVGQISLAQNSDGSSSTQQQSTNHRSPIGLYIEPSIKAANIQGTIEYPSPFRNTDIKAQAAGVSAALGFHISDVIFVAMEGNYSRFSTDNSGGTNDYSDDGSAYSYGPTLGVQTPLAGIRVWGTYLAGGELDPGQRNGVDLKFKDFKGYRVGLGVRIAFVGVSLEYEDGKYDTTEVQQAGPFTGSSSAVQLKTQSWIAGLNFPISL